MIIFDNKYCKRSSILDETLMFKRDLNTTKFLTPDLSKTAGSETLVVKASSIWGLAWNPSQEESYDILCVADWGKTVSFYSLSGKQVLAILSTYICVQIIL